MRRRRGARQDSLELFLDTICNMFGGFIFLMLFVVVTLRTTSVERAMEQTQRERASAGVLWRLEQELADLQNEWDEYAQGLEDSREFTERLFDPRVAEIYRQTLEKLDEIRTIDETTAENERKLAALEAQNLELDASSREKQRELDQARRTLAQAERNEQEAKAKRSRKVYAPKMHYSSKQEAAVVLKYGRLYFWHRFDGPLGSRRRLNTDDMIPTLREGSRVRVEPKPDGGIDLSSGDVVAQMTGAFAKYSPREFVITMVVSGDSYEEFGIVRDFLTSRDYEIRPMIGEPGQAVYDRGGTNTNAQ